MQERIIQFLKESDGYISGEEISQRLKMSRAAIWKHMQELRAQGYEIAAVPHLGYQLVTCPDKLLSYELFSFIPACAWGGLGASVGSGLCWRRPKSVQVPEP